MARTYDEGEAEAILGGAAQAAAESPADDGVTLAELESAAGEVGLDAALVRNAAREIDRVEERPIGERKYGASVRLTARATVEGQVDVDALANRLFAAMADQVGEPGTPHAVGEARVWKTALFGRGVDAGPGQSQSLTLRPVEGGAELVLREDVEREAATGVAIRAIAGGLAGALVTFIVGDAFGPVDDAIAFAVFTMPIHATFGWLAGKRWWRGRRRRLAEAHDARMKALARSSQPALPEAAPRAVPPAGATGPSDLDPGDDGSGEGP